MSGAGREYRFEIGAFSPETMPFNRLVDYLHDLVDLFGEPRHVHLIGIEPGSARPVFLVDKEAEETVRRRIESVHGANPVPAARRAWCRINKRLVEDGTCGAIIDPVGEKILAFPGRETESPVFGPFNQAGSLRGVPILVGGTADPVAVRLEDKGKVWACRAKRDIAKEIAKHIFSSLIEVEGVGRWLRREDGEWDLMRFTISDFKVLDEVDLRETVRRLQEIPAAWKDLDDPLAELRRIRRGS